uniref:probable serine/threonine-protein kinase PBL28 n=1 Tax=Erigeron canadensis TaxID=72917 RepID=UPI001CB8EB07|nr:probable serine/threonine-protein kinase PBL28 [Erigeron canadensis]
MFIIFTNLMSLIQELDHLKIPLKDIKLATKDFSDDNFIGQGGYGRVYRGQLSLSATNSNRPTTTVAIKRLDVKGGQGQQEFLTELTMLSSYKHDNLVSLVGFCDEDDEKIIVYEHEVRGSLDKYLATTDITWVQRILICLGAARGLNYLHSGVGEGHRVLHRDIKSSNILLDVNWEAKISDFGLSKIGPANQQFTFLVTNACGTLGYIDPLYATTDILTKESDVYSFGVVLFEVLCGRLAIDTKYHDERRYLSKLVKLHYKEGRLEEIIMTNLLTQMKLNSLRTFYRIAYQCLKKDRKQRPTMGILIEELQNSLEFQIGCQKITRIGLWGSSTGGTPWSLQLENNQKLRKITIDHKEWIYSMIFTTQDYSGLLQSTKRYGGNSGYRGGKVSEINFDGDEEITEMIGTVGVTTGNHAGFTVISSLCFVTNKKTDGPFGKQTGARFSVPWDTGSFAGFYGRGGLYIDGLGCYLRGVM